MSARTALLLAVLLLVAGCNAPSDRADGTGQPTTVESPSDRETTTTAGTTQTASTNFSTIPVEGGRLGVDPNRVYRRLTGQLGVDVRPPDRIRVVDPSVTKAILEPPNFLARLGVRTPASETGLSARAIGTDVIQVNRSVATRPRVEALLAHEFVHVVQLRRNATDRMFASPGWADLPYGVERRLLIDSVEEGVATHAATRYQRPSTDTLPQGTRYERLYRRQETAAGRYFMAPYWFGYRYVADRVAENGTVASVYDRPPRTTEAIIHRLEPGTEPPVPVSVNVTADQWQADDRERVGELGTRIALSASHNASRAAAGADGWGNDVLVPFRHDSATGYVWVLRWDDAANESEFRTAFTDALDRQTTRTDLGWRDDDTAFRVRQGEERTTVVTVGPPEFVRNASANVGQQVVTRGP